MKSHAWQKKYNPVMVHMHRFYLEMQSPNFIQREKAMLQLAFACMILEGYVFKAEFPNKKKWGNVGKNVVKPLYNRLYKYARVEMSSDSAKLIGEVRNGITHGGGLSDLFHSLSEDKEKDGEIIKGGKSLARKMAESQKENPEDLIDSFTHGFNQLYEDMMLRILGLNQDELGRNGNPSWNYFYWKKEEWKS